MWLILCLVTPSFLKRQDIWTLTEGAAVILMKYKTTLRLVKSTRWKLIVWIVQTEIISSASLQMESFIALITSASLRVALKIFDFSLEYPLTQFNQFLKHQFIYHETWLIVISTVCKMLYFLFQLPFILHANNMEHYWKEFKQSGNGWFTFYNNPKQEQLFSPHFFENRRLRGFGSTYFLQRISRTSSSGCKCSVERGYAPQQRKKTVTSPGFPHSKSDKTPSGSFSASWRLRLKASKWWCPCMRAFNELAGQVVH